MPSVTAWLRGFMWFVMRLSVPIYTVPNEGQFLSRQVGNWPNNRRDDFFNLPKLARAL
jgi:hypothetical protein